jgi:hypothetical protein
MTLRITGISHSDQPNVGDRNCSPLQYFNFPDAVSISYRDALPKTDVLIVGGGVLPKTIPTAPIRVAWGVGRSRKGYLAKIDAPAHEGWDLIGSRDKGARPWVPCPSCMSPLFDREYETQHSRVYFDHQSYPTGGRPSMSNDVADMAEAIAFIASGQTVVTSSYHGMYWATLLGRRVVVVPFGSKFFGFPYPVPMTRYGQGEGIAHPDALQQCREANIAFYQQVLSFIGLPPCLKS